MSKITMDNLSNALIAKLKVDLTGVCETVEKINSLIIDINNYVQDSESTLKEGIVSALKDLGCDVSNSSTMGELLIEIENLRLVNGTTATSKDIIQGKTITDDNGNVIIGEMPINSTIDISNVPTAEGIELPSGLYKGNIYIEGDEKLIASNIKYGVNIFGVTGSTYEKL